LPTIAAIARVGEPLPKGLEGASLGPVLAGGPDAMVKRLREELVIHVPHYDRDAEGPASALLLGNYKLIHTYEMGTLHLFDLGKDAGEQHDLVNTMTTEATALDKRLTDYLTAVKAQMPAANPLFDPAKARPVEERPGRRKPDGG